jgi:BON domain
MRRLGLRGIGLVVGGLSVLALTMTGCSRVRDNAQLTSDVQKRIRNDYRLQMARIQVRSTDGIVTLSGYVSTDAQRAATVQDAAQINGVRVVVDNLRMDNVGTTGLATIKLVPVNPPAALQKPSASIVRSNNRFSPQIISHSDAVPAAVSVGSSNPVAPVPPVSTQSSSAAAPVAQVVPVASVSSDGPSGEFNETEANPARSTPPRHQVPRVERVTVPEGTALDVRLTETLSSELNEKGDTFLATLASPIMVDDRVVIPAGAGVQGRVVGVQSAGRFSGKPGLVIEVTRLAYNGESYELSSNQYSKQGSFRTTRAAATIGGGAGVGALIGGILGGGRGAAIGAMIGAGAGTGVQAKAKPPEVQLPAEAMLSFRLENPLTVVPASTLQGMQGSDPSQDPFSSDERPVLKRRPGSRPAEPDTDQPGADSPSDRNPPEDSAPPEPDPN